MTEENSDVKPKQGGDVQAADKAAPIIKPQTHRRFNIFIGSIALFFLGFVGFTFYDSYVKDKRIEEANAIYAPQTESCEPLKERYGQHFAEDPDLLKLARKKFPDNMCAWYKAGVFEYHQANNLSHSSSRLSHLEDAVEYLQRAYAIRDSFNARLILGKVNAELGRFEEAKHHLEAALSFTSNAEYGGLDFEIAVTSNWLAYVSFVQRDAQGLMKYAQMSQDHNDPLLFHTYKGMALLWTGRDEEAKQEFLASKGVLENADVKDKTIFRCDFEVHNSWVKYRHLIMAYHGLQVIADNHAVPLAERGSLFEREQQLTHEALNNGYLTNQDIDAIVLNNPPKEQAISMQKREIEK